MLKYLGWSVWTFILSVVFSATLNAQTNFVYTNNDPYLAENSISAFSVGAGGTLTEIAGSPFHTCRPTDPISTCLGSGSTSYSPNRIIVVNNFLYASNAGSNTISAFTIQSDGTLAQVGPPIPTQAFDSSPSGISLAATPDGKYLYAGSTGFLGQITIFTIGLSGALQFDSVTPYGFVGGAMSSMKVSPNGKFLAVALYQSNEVAMFDIQSDGTLTTVTGSPFVANAGDNGTYIDGIDINCASDHLFAGRDGQDIDVFEIAPTGALSELAGSPFSTGLSGNQVLVLDHPDDSILFSSDQINKVTAFAVSGGSLTIPGTTKSAGTDAISPGGLAVSQNGAFLYAADRAISGTGFGGISTFDLVTSPPISFVPPIASTGLATFALHSLAAYPPNVCSTTSGGTMPKLTVTKTLNPAADPRRFNLQINGTTWATNVGDGGTTGAQDGVIGSNTVGETVGTPGTSLSDFDVVIGGDCAADGTITLAADDNKTCTITNTRKLPTLTSIDPTSAIVGSPGFRLSLTGTNFGADSTAQFNGSDLTTHYTSPDTAHLTADVPASDLTTVGQIPLTVHNSLTTVGSSNSLYFTVAYKFLGLFEPYAPPARFYRVNSSIPLRWQYASADGTPTPSPNADPLVEIYPAAGCGNNSTGDVLRASAPGNSGYLYHAPSMTWQFNWKTGGSVGAGCYVIYIKSQQTGQTDGPFPIQLAE